VSWPCEAGAAFTVSAMVLAIGAPAMSFSSACALGWSNRAERAGTRETSRPARPDGSNRSAAEYPAVVADYSTRKVANNQRPATAGCANSTLPRGRVCASPDFMGTSGSSLMPPVEFKKVRVRRRLPIPRARTRWSTVRATATERSLGLPGDRYPRMAAGAPTDAA